MANLPINIEDLLRQRTVEGERIEYKQGWNPAPIIRSLCAFANDFENLGGGYIVVGQNCDENGQPLFPPSGLLENQLDRIQQELLRYCSLIQPSYFPLFCVEEFEGIKLVVLWAPGGQNRPYSAPREVTANRKEYHYYIRRYSSTVQVSENSDEMRELLALTATIPFDDRQCIQASIEDLNPSLIREYLTNVGSSLARKRNLSMGGLSQQMNIVDGPTESLKPRNVGILFFNDEPTTFLPGAQIDVVIFPKGPGGGSIIEKTFHGPIHEQVRSALRYIQNEVIREKIIKQRDEPEAIRLFNFPFPAVEEALVNAVYHRSYEQAEPIEVRVNPDKIDVLSYPGPDASIRIEALNEGRVIARRYRNRRIGDFLKELELTEGRSTGIPTMRAAMVENGSPPPTFFSDDQRTYFHVELMAHPDFGDFLQQADLRETPTEELTATEWKVLELVGKEPRRKVEIAEYLGVDRRSGNLKRALDSLQQLQLLELTIPDKPTSRNQKYRITETGRNLLTT